jgi:hypothetical protein
MTTRVMSIRLPVSVERAVRASAKNARMSVSSAALWLLLNSLTGIEQLRGLSDCSEMLNAKLDIRIPFRTFEQLKLTAQTLGISISVYTRIILYHFYVSKRVSYTRSGDRYTLAVHD